MRHRGPSYGLTPALVELLKEKVVSCCQVKTGRELAPSQRAALRQALTSRALILTGGPGIVLGNLIDSGVGI